MDNGMLLVAVGILAGLLIGGVFSSFRQQRYRYQQQLALQLLEQEKEQLLADITVFSDDKQRLESLLLQREQELRKLDSQLATVQEKVQQYEVWRQEYGRLDQEIRTLREVNRVQETDLREVTIRLEETRLAAEEKQRLLVNSEQRLTEQFENLANRIFEQSGRRVDEQNKQSLNGLLTPLREQIDGFRRQVQEGLGQEARERHTLTHEIRSLQQLNEKMAREALNLTRALKGDNKMQGNWGEVVLGRVLEASGLREGHEYETQVSVRTEGQTRVQPDVIVRLPESKDVIIDAKMSLVAYERYFNSEEELEREQCLKEHIASIRSHIKLLSSKDYHKVPALRSLDYVLLFIPVEPAFLTAVEQEPALLTEALQQNIMLVSPTTLLVALRTISNLWRYEYQTQNAQQIAERAARLYDKFRLFVDDMEGMGQSLERATNSYQASMNKLVQGRGNLISQVEKFRELGVEVKRGINPALVEQAQSNSIHTEEQSSAVSLPERVE